MGNSELKFVFLKTPQLRHKFMSHDKHNIFPIIRHEVYYAKLVGESYEIFGRSYSGAVAIDDFNQAIQEGYVSLVIDA
jgi:hypothetical protein